MDAETIRLLISTSGGVVAGIAAAIVAGYFNRKNTSDTLADNLIRVELQHSFEHRKILRDQKSALYAELITALNMGTAEIGRAHFEKPRRFDMGALRSATWKARETGWKIFLLPGVDNLAEPVMAANKAQLELLGIVEDSINTGTPAVEADFQKATADYEGALAALTSALRADLVKTMDAALNEADEQGNLGS
jgi:hypothetical protein